MSKAKKNILITLIALAIMTAVMLCCVFSTTAYAASAETISETETTGQIPTEETDETEETAVPETFFTRLESWFNDNFLEFLSTVNFGSILACIVVAITEKKGNKKNTTLTLEKLGLNTESNGEVVKTVNALIENYNATIEKLNEMESKNEKRDMICGELETFTKAILEILTTVYANNKNIPQAVKDLVSLKYVNALKADNSVKCEELPAEVKTETEEV